jgi:hypothetical protein
LRLAGGRADAAGAGQNITSGRRARLCYDPRFSIDSTLTLVHGLAALIFAVLGVATLLGAGLGF